MSSSDSFDYESIQDTETIRDFIGSLLDGLENRKIILSSNGNKISLHPSDMLKFAVKAKRKGQTGKISLKISWRESANENSNQSDDIKISKQ